MARGNAAWYPSVRRFGFRGKRRKHRRCSSMAMGSGAAALGICKVIGQWFEGKCALGWVPARTGERCKEIRKWSSTLKYPCEPTHVGISTWVHTLPTPHCPAVRLMPNRWRA